MNKNQKNNYKELTFVWFEQLRTKRNFVLQEYKINLEKEKNNLIERLGVCLETNEKLPPLAARILSTLILTGKKGCSFEQLVQQLSASKSTISLHLSTLEASGRINYFTKQGDRKRYFTISKGHTVSMINDVIAKWEKQKAIHADILDFKKRFNKLHENDAEEQLDLHLHQNYLIFIEEANSALQKLKQTIINKQNNE